MAGSEHELGASNNSYRGCQRLLGARYTDSGSPETVYYRLGQAFCDPSAYSNEPVSEKHACEIAGQRRANLLHWPQSLYAVAEYR